MPPLAKSQFARANDAKIPRPTTEAGKQPALPKTPSSTATPLFTRRSGIGNNRSLGFP